MENLLNRYDKQSMKVAILKHEETFKEQVYELHRLYRVQKMLMINMRSDRRAYRHEQQRLNRGEANYINKEQQQLVHQGQDCELVDQTEDDIDFELTLGPARYRTRKKTLNSETGRPSFSSSSSSTESTSFAPSRTSAKTHKRREGSTGQQRGLIQVRCRP